MKRLGKFTGRVYSEKQNLDDIKECAVCIPDDISEDALNVLRVRNQIDCRFCIPDIYACPEKMKAQKNGC